MIDVERTAQNVFLISRTLAGLAGAIEVHGVTFAFTRTSRGSPACRLKPRAQPPISYALYILIPG